MSDREIHVTSGRLRATVARQAPWRIAFSFDGRPLASSGPDDLAYLTEADGRAFMRERLSLAVGECVYGLGERFGPLVKNGQSIDIWNEDGGTSTDIAYKNIPFFLTSRGYGVLVNHAESVSFEVGSEAVSKVQFSVAGERLEYFVVGGGSPEEVLRRYTQAHRPARASSRMVLRAVADHVVHDRLRREHRQLLRPGHAGSRHPPPRVPLRLLLDEGVPVV